MFTSDFATLCYIGKSSQYQKVWSPECIKSHLCASALLKFLPAVILRTPFKKGKGGREKEGKGHKMEGRERRRDRCRREGAGRGKGDPPFTNPLTVACTVFTGPRMWHGCRVMHLLPPAQSTPQTMNICERNGGLVYST
jgi:hypothetical protein